MRRVRLGCGQVQPCLCPRTPLHPLTHCHHRQLPHQVIFWVCVTVWLINYHHFITLAWVPGSFLPDFANSTFSLAK